METAHILVVTKKSGECPVTFSGDFTKYDAELAYKALLEADYDSGDAFGLLVVVVDTGRPLPEQR